MPGREAEAAEAERGAGRAGRCRPTRRASSIAASSVERAASPPDCICACPRRSSSSPRRGLVGLGQQVEGGAGRRRRGRRRARRPARASASCPARWACSSALAGSPTGGRLDEVVGQLGLAARRVALERLADGGVQAGAAGGGQVAVERLADEAVGEAERAGRPRRLLEQLHGERLVEALEEVGAVDARRPLERRELEVAALDGGHLERLADLGAQRQQAPADGVAHAVGQRQRARPAAGRCGPGPRAGARPRRSRTGCPRSACAAMCTSSSDGSAPLRWMTSARRSSSSRPPRSTRSAEARELAEDGLDLGPARAARPRGGW